MRLSAVLHSDAISNSPFDAGSKFPGAGSVRIATATHFILKETNTPFMYMNTHLDDQSDAQRMLGASLILWRAHFEAAKNNGHSIVLVTGDFNRLGPLIFSRTFGF